MVQVKLSGISIRYGNVRAVEKMDLNVRDKEFLTILGPSGGGKTSTLRVIAGLEEPTEGEVHMDGKLVNEIAPGDRNLGMVFQNYALFSHMTARENIAFPLSVRKIDKAEIEKRINEVAKLLRIEALLDRKPKQLSGGEQQRVALGRAIVRKPDVFLMDEPLSNLDAALRTKMRVELKKLQKDLQTTLIYVTHDQTEAMSMADRIAVIKDGALLQVGTPEEIYSTPATGWIGSFVGSPPMNLIECTVSDGGSLVVSGGCNLELPQAFVTKITKLSPGKRLKLGVRPEDIEIAQKPTGLSCEAEVYISESTGDSTIVDLELGENLIKVKTKAGYNAKVGEKVSVGFNPNRISLFDAVSDKVL